LQRRQTSRIEVDPRNAEVPQAHLSGSQGGHVQPQGQLLEGNRGTGRVAEAEAFEHHLAMQQIDTCTVHRHAHAVAREHVGHAVLHRPRCGDNSNGEKSEKNQHAPEQQAPQHRGTALAPRLIDGMSHERVIALDARPRASLPIRTRRRCYHVRGALPVAGALLGERRARTIESNARRGPCRRGGQFTDDEKEP